MMPIYCSKGHENPANGRFCQMCGEKLPLPVSQGIYQGMILGERYKVERQLGHGGFGRTYLAYDQNRFNEACVLKEFAPQVQGTYALQKAEELFEREAGVLYQLEHRQIPRFREMFRANLDNEGQLFLVQDYVEGFTYRTLLDNRMRQGLRFGEAEVIQLMLQLLPVLEYIHNLGVIHRDISPDNLILRSKDQLPVLIDFGGVKQVAATVESQFHQPVGGTASIPTRLGKPGYAPDEQMHRGMVSPHSDLYALAATVLVLLTGKEPQQLIDSQTLAWNWQREIRVSPMLGAILDQMLKYRPGERYQSAREVLQALTGNPPVVSYPPTQTPTQAPIQPATNATMAVAPPRNPVTPVAAAGKLPVPQVTSQPSSRGLGMLKATLIVLLVILGAAGLGWWAGNLWLKSLRGREQPPEIVESPDSEPPVDQEKPAPQFSAEEQARKQALRDRRLARSIDYNFYVNWVNEAFWTKYPDQRERRLGNGPEDEQWRQRWDETAAELLSQLEKTNLSPEARRKMGSYTQADRDRWKREANKFRLSSRALYDLADAPFFRLFPQYKGEDILNRPIGQVWQAFVEDRLQAIQSGSVVETIRFDPGTTSKQVSGVLKAGQGKAYIAQLSTGQLMQLQLQAGSKILLSVYTPTGKTQILEDSRERSWSGELPESGYYEMVVVSNGSGSGNYQLSLTVENPPETPSPEPTESVTPSPEPSESPTPSEPTEPSDSPNL